MCALRVLKTRDDDDNDMTTSSGSSSSSGSKSGSEREERKRKEEEEKKPRAFDDAIDESAKKKKKTKVRSRMMKASSNAKNLESNAGDAKGIITRRAGRRLDDDDEEEKDDGCAKAPLVSDDSTTKCLSSLSMGELKRRAREARGRFVLSEKAIAAGGDQTTKFGYCLMYLNAIQKSVNKLDFGGGFFKGRGQTTARTTTRRRYPWEVFERDEEEEEKKRKTKKQKMEDDQREHNNCKSNREKAERKEEEEEEDTKTLAPLMETSGTKTKSSTPRKRRAKDANAWEENNEMAIKPIKIRSGRYPGEYCQLCGEHEHMVHVKYASQLLGEGKLVCYECLTNEKKELERKEKELANAKERQKRKERQKNRATRMEMMISSPTTTPTTSNVDLRNNNNNSSSSPPSGTLSASALPHHQSSSPISVAVVVDGETVTLNTIVHGTTTAAAAAAAVDTTTTAIHNAEKIEAIHDVSIACDWCGKDTFRTAGQLERHKTKWCIAKAGAVIIGDSRIQATATTSSENEGEQNSDNIGKTIAAKAIANIIAKTEEGRRGERKQLQVHARKCQEALGRMTREHDRLKENLSKEAECNKERDVVVADECAMEAPPDVVGVVTKPSLPGDDDDENDKARVDKATREDTIAGVIKTELVADRGDVDDEKKKDNEDTAIVDNNAQVPPVPGRAEEVLQLQVDLPPLVIDAKDREPPGISTLNASDIPRKARPSSPHKDPHVGRRTLLLAEVLRMAKDGHPVTRNVSSGILPQASVVISDIIEKSTIEPAENFSRRRASYPLDQKHKDEKRRLSGGPSMREFEMKEWRTENVHALHHAKTDK